MDRVKRIVWAVALAMTAALTGCDDAGEPAAQRGAAGAPAPAAAFDPWLWLGEAPAEAQPVSAVKRDAAAGEEVVVRGRVAGQRQPFERGRAVLLLADLDLGNCTTMGMHTCPTPWDSCCEPGANVEANTLSVEVPGPDGQPVAASLEGVQGLEPMSEVIVRGTIAEGRDGKIVRATGIHVVPAEAPAAS